MAWIVDDTGFPKQGKHSAGVARQYCGQVGKQDNCQVAVSLSVSTWSAVCPSPGGCICRKCGARTGHAANRLEFRRDIEFQTKPEIALDQMRQAVEQKVPVGVVLADAAYGNGMQFRAPSANSEQLCGGH